MIETALDESARRGLFVLEAITNRRNSTQRLERSNRQTHRVVRQFKVHYFLIGAAVCTTIVGLIVAVVSLQRLAVRSGFLGWSRVSPFTEVQFGSEDSVTVQFENAEYQLVSISDIPTATILATCRHEFGVRWEKRFVEDPVEVLILTGHRPGRHVKLVLRVLDGNLKTAPMAPLTAENRQKAYDARQARLKSNEATDKVQETQESPSAPLG